MNLPEFSAKPQIAPVQQTERVQIVDILRGFALFCIPITLHTGMGDKTWGEP